MQPKIAEAANEKALVHRKTGNEGIQRIPPEDNPAGWPHPSLDGEVGPAKAEPGRAQSNRYPDFGLNLAPAFPVE